MGDDPRQTSRLFSFLHRNGWFSAVSDQKPGFNPTKPHALRENWGLNPGFSFPWHDLRLTFSRLSMGVRAAVFLKAGSTVRNLSHFWDCSVRFQRGW